MLLLRSDQDRQKIGLRRRFTDAVTHSGKKSDPVVTVEYELKRESSMYERCWNRIAPSSSWGDEVDLHICCEVSDGEPLNRWELAHIHGTRRGGDDDFSPHSVDTEQDSGRLRSLLCLGF